MNGVNAFFLGQGDDAVNVQIGFNRALAFADLVGLIGFETVQAQPIFFGLDGDGAQTELGRGAHDADRDLAAIQGKEFFHAMSGPVSCIGKTPETRSLSLARKAREEDSVIARKSGSPPATFPLAL
jgi:hypothetical protein